MNLFKRIFNFYINSSIHVALAVCALVGVTVLEHQFDIDFYTVGFIFFGTITGYNFVKYSKIAGLHHRTLTESLKSIQIFSFLSFVLFVFFAFQVSSITLLVSGGFGLLTFFYAVPISNKYSLRTLSGLKIFIVAVVWAGVTVFVPIVATKIDINTDYFITYLQRILIVITLTIPFEIRDLNYDLKTLKTLPQQIGLKNVKLLGGVLLGIVILIDLFKSVFTKTHFVSLLITCLLIGFILIITKRNQNKYFASFWVEGIPIVWYLILLESSKLF